MRESVIKYEATDCMGRKHYTLYMFGIKQVYSGSLEACRDYCKRYNLKYREEA